MSNLVCFDHCPICLSRIVLPNPNSGDESHILSQNEEICRRFSTLVTRYLHFTTDYVEPKITLGSCQKLASTVVTHHRYLCDGCVPAAESFCQKYETWFCLQLEMNRCLDDLAQLIVLTQPVDKVESCHRRGFITSQGPFHTSDKGGTERKLHFREILLEKVEWSRRTSFPRLTLQKEDCNPGSTGPDAAEQAFSALNLVTAVSDFCLKEADESYLDDNNCDEDFTNQVSEGVAVTVEDGAECVSNGVAFNQTEVPLRTSAVPKEGKQETHGCPHCSKQFNCRRSLLTHIRNLHEEDKRPFLCVLCQMSFRYYTPLECHIRSHTKEKPCFCQICQKEFYSRRYLRKHVRLDHLGESRLRYTCQFCSNQFTTKYECKLHEKKQHDDGLESRNLETSSALLPDNMDCTNSAIDCVPAPVKPANVTETPALDAFILDDTETLQEKPWIRKEVTSQCYHCPVCSKQFILRRNLYHHIRFVHKAVRPFQCLLCQRGVRSYSAMERHMQKHTKERPYICNMCHLEFVSQQYLRLHKRVKHFGDIQIRECQFCFKQFGNKYLCNRHEKTVHKDQLAASNLASNESLGLKCRFCKALFTSGSEFKLHLNSHNAEIPFLCEVCGKRFAKKTYLRFHMPTHTAPRIFKCSLCPKAFIKQLHLTRHLEAHTSREDKPFLCSICAAQYARRRDLAKHCRKIHNLNSIP